MTNRESSYSCFPGNVFRYFSKYLTNLGKSIFFTVPKNRNLLNVREREYHRLKAGNPSFRMVLKSRQSATYKGISRSIKNSRNFGNLSQNYTFFERIDTITQLPRENLCTSPIMNLARPILHWVHNTKPSRPFILMQ